MSNSAGTLLTTYNSTYIPPRFMPQYQGHVPTMKFDYAETYGNATAKYFQDYRSKTLDKSRSVYHKGGYFPTQYSHNPDLVIGNRTRTHDRWLTAPRYSLTNVDHDRKEELIRFDRLGHAHREHYNDKSDTVHAVEYFKLPTPAAEQFKRHDPFQVLATRHTDAINLTDDGSIPRRAPYIRPNYVPMSSQRDREMRDVYFENRGHNTPTPRASRDGTAASAVEPATARTRTATAENC